MVCSVCGGVYYACTYVMCLCSMYAHIALYVVYACTLSNEWVCAVCMCVVCGMYAVCMCVVCGMYAVVEG